MRGNPLPQPRAVGRSVHAKLLGKLCVDGGAPQRTLKSDLCPLVVAPEAQHLAQDCCLTSQEVDDCATHTHAQIRRIAAILIAADRFNHRQHADLHQIVEFDSARKLRTDLPGGGPHEPAIFADQPFFSFGRPGTRSIPFRSGFVLSIEVISQLNVCYFEYSKVKTHKNVDIY